MTALLMDGHEGTTESTMGETRISSIVVVAAEEGFVCVHSQARLSTVSTLRWW